MSARIQFMSRSFALNSVLLGALLFSMPTATASQEATPQVERGSTEIAQAFVDARQGKLSDSQLTTSLARTRVKALPELFETLRRGRFDVRIGDRGNSTRKLGPKERETLVAAVGLLPWSDVKLFFEELRASELDESQRLAALAILRGLGTDQDLWEVLRWSTPADPKQRAPQSVRSAFAGALASIIERSPQGLSKMSDLYGSAQLSLVPSIISTLGSTDSAASLSELAEVLGKVPGADALVLAEISHLGSTVQHPIDKHDRDRVRVYLDSSDRSLQIEGILACGRLEDTDGVPNLIELLSHPNPSIKKRALKSLKEITSQLYGYDPVDWLDWTAKIERWHRERSPDLLNDVAAGSAAVASRAVLECSKQRFFRHELAPKLTKCLTRPQEDLVILTCAALGHLGSVQTVPDIRRCLDHPSTDVRRAALLALKRITGEDHGEESRAWAAAGW